MRHDFSTSSRKRLTLRIPCVLKWGLQKKPRRALHNVFWLLSAPRSVFCVTNVCEPDMLCSNDTEMKQRTINNTFLWVQSQLDVPSQLIWANRGKGLWNTFWQSNQFRETHGSFKTVRANIQLSLVRIYPNETRTSHSSHILGSSAPQLHIWGQTWGLTRV